MYKLLCILILLSTLPMENKIHAKIINTDETYSYEALKEDLEKIKAVYNREVKIMEIGRTPFGRNIYALRLGRGNKNIVLIGAHHGREWLTSMLLMKKLEVYADAYKFKKKLGPFSADILNDVSIWFIPMLNPDGVTIQQNNLLSFPLERQKLLFEMNDRSQNFNRWKANGLGIDLNRQYPAGWKQLPKESVSPFYKFYKGKKPFEANEVKDLVKFINVINPTIAVAYHSSGREVFWNYHNGKHFYRDKKIARKVSNLTGYKLAKPPQHAVGGGFTDWFITKYHRPAMTIEICPLVDETSPPLSCFEEEWIRNKYVGLTLAREAKKLTKLHLIIFNHMGKVRIN